MLGQAKHASIGVGFVGEGRANMRQRFARWVRANFFLPDARVGWVPFALRRARQLLAEDTFDAVITSGPPHSTHLIGKRLAKKLPWISDFRDPWTDISYYCELPHTFWARRLDARLERKVLSRADRIIAVSEAMGQLFSNKGCAPVTILTNGFDPGDFTEAGTQERSDRFVIAHVGNLSAAQNPVALWHVLRALDAIHTMPALRIQFVGNVDPVVLASIEENGLMSIVEITPYVPHREAVRYMQSATLLLLSINKVRDAKCIMTGKVFEYIATGKPVMGLGPKDGDAARLLLEVSGGRMYDHDNELALVGGIRWHYSNWESGTALPGADANDIKAYDRRQQAGTLASLLDELCPS